MSTSSLSNLSDKFILMKFITSPIVEIYNICNRRNYFNSETFLSDMAAVIGIINNTHSTS